jgi:phospholipase C
MNTRRVIATTLIGFLSCPLAPIAAPARFDKEPGAPIQHIVVIFNENISFDHYFGTYPHAMNPAGEPEFKAADDTPTANTLVGGLLNDNPNLFNSANGAGASNPFRLDRGQAVTADQDHDYGPEQLAFNHGLMDLFPFSVGVAGGGKPTPPPAVVGTTGLTMGYYDGNTVTALWNYAQRFAMNDNSFGTNFGPSTVGALNLVSGQTNGITNKTGATDCADCAFVSDGHSNFTVIGDPDPALDVCSTSSSTVTMSGPNVGDLLNQHNITWGWFQGGFDLTKINAPTTVGGVSTTGCARASVSTLVTSAQKDYVPHHEPFQYYASTRNPTHARPTATGMIGRTDVANHQYDINDFYAAVQNGNMPAVSFLKPIKLQNGHAGNSDPLDEQVFLVHVLNFLQSRPEWASTAVILAYDDSDGWYDHVMSPIVNQSTTNQDHLTTDGFCGTSGLTSALDGPSASHVQGRCGYGPRLPLMVFSPWAKRNFIDHTTTDQSSILKFIEDTFAGGERLGSGSFDAIAHSIRNMFDFDDKPNMSRLTLDEKTGQPIQKRDDQDQDRDR